MYPDVATKRDKQRIDSDRQDMHREFIKRNEKASKERVSEKIFSIILERLSEESKRVVQSNPRYNTEADVKESGTTDPVVLIEIIQATHLGYVGTNDNHWKLARYSFVSASMRINQDNDSLEVFAERLLNHFKTTDAFAMRNPLPQPIPDDPDNMEVVPILEEDWYAERLVECVKGEFAEAVASYRNQVNAKTREMFKTINEAVNFIRVFVPSKPIEKKSAYKVAARKAGKFKADDSKKEIAGKQGAASKGGKVKSIKQLRMDNQGRVDKNSGQIKYPGKCRKCAYLNAKGDWDHWWDQCPNNLKRDRDDDPKDDAVDPEDGSNGATGRKVAYIIKGGKKIKQ